MKEAESRDDCCPSPLRRSNSEAWWSPGPGPACGTLCTVGCPPGAQEGSSEMGCLGWTGRLPLILL